MRVALVYTLILCLSMVCSHVVYAQKQDERVVWYSSLNVQEKHSRQEGKSFDKVKIEQIKLKKLAHIAHYFGISSDGKSIVQLQAEIEQAKKAQPEKWELFKTELHKRKLQRLHEQ